ncbi:hypothetical protein ABZ356_26205 [Micromonospora zamorensis]
MAGAAAWIASAARAAKSLRSVGAAVNDVARDATAYPHREQNFSVLAATG